MTGGTFFSIKTISMEITKSYELQTLLSYADYPNMFKLLVTPFIDSNYLPGLGKAKTYLTVAGILSGLSMFFLGSETNHMINNGQHSKLVLTWIFLQSMSTINSATIDFWSTTLLRGKYKRYGGVALSMGGLISKVLTFDFFIPLSSTKWLNKTLYKNNPRDTPLVTLKQLCQFIGIFQLVCVFLMVFFVAERSPQRGDQRPPTFKEIWTIVPKILRKHSYVSLMIVVLSFDLFLHMMVHPFVYKLIELGFPNSKLAVDHFMGFPAAIFFKFLAYYLIKEGKMIRRSTIVRICMTGVSILGVYYILQFEQDRDIDKLNPKVIFIVCLRSAEYMSFIFWYGFLSDKIQPQFAATIISIYRTFGTFASNITNTMSNFLMSYVKEFRNYCIPMILATCIMFVLLWPLVLKVDTLKKEE
jgi:hypothetical protein